jgi:hypothetical protein
MTCAESRALSTGVPAPTVTRAFTSKVTSERVGLPMLTDRFSISLPSAVPQSKEDVNVPTSTQASSVRATWLSKSVSW